MSRLHTELHRLYLSPALPPSAAAATDGPPPLVDAQGRVRALVLGLAGPGSWTRLQPVWAALQQVLDLPASAIVVDGVGALQLWLSLAEPVPAAAGHAFLQQLVQQHLADVAPSRVTVWPLPGAAPDGGVAHAASWPGQPQRPGQWSALVAPDLAPVFADEPWLDVPPNDEGQAELLGRLRPITPEAWGRALVRLAPAAAPPAPPAGAAPTVRAPEASAAPTTATSARQQARQFLLAVMHDPQVALPLRVDAARALLHQPPQGGEAGEP